MERGDDLRRRSAQATFLVRVVEAAGGGVFRGRVEHVWSGRVAEFDSAEALRAFMERVVRDLLE